MSTNFTMVLPFEMSTWDSVTQCIHNILIKYEEVKNISDVMDNLRIIRQTYKGFEKDIYCDNMFVGLGLFLGKLGEQELFFYIDVCIRNILYYIRIGGQFESIPGNKIFVENNETRVSMLSAKSMLACSVLCLMPSVKQHVNIEKVYNNNLHQLYAGIVHGSKNHSELLKAVLNYFVGDPHKTVDQERQSFISFSTHNSDLPSFSIPDSLQSWPIILTSKSIITNKPLPNYSNLMPMFFERFCPSTLFSSSDLTSELPIYSNLPVLIPLLPLVVIRTPENVDVIDIRCERFHYSIQRVHFLNSWDRLPQYDEEYIKANIAHSLVALRSPLQIKHLPNVKNVKSSTESVIENAIQKLNSKSSKLCYSNSFSETLHRSRSSLTSHTLPAHSQGSRQSSICSNSVTRSARHSYSTSSSSRSGSLQLSSVSSRRSSSNVSSAMNKDAESCNAPGDKVDFSLHQFQPIIVEESGNHGDEDEIPLDPMKIIHESTCSSEICSPKFPFDKSLYELSNMSLSQKVLLDNVERNTLACGMRRRNSSPILGQFFEDKNEDNKLIFEQKELYNRCCEEDANNDHLIRLNNRGRRQSLPCHLKWLHQLPLKNSTNENVSQSPSIIEVSFSNIFDESVDNFLDGRIIVDSNKILSKLLSFADALMDGIYPSGIINDQQNMLRKEILQKRDLYQSMSLDACADRLINPVENQKSSNDNHCLHSGDLAIFDSVLNSSTFIDNEALQFFSKFSTMSSSSSVWMPHDESNVDQNEICVENVSNPICGQFEQEESNKSTIDEYVNQLTKSIINDVMDHEFVPSGITINREAVRFYNLADRVSLEIIATSLLETGDHSKEPLDEFSLIYVRPFPLEYDRPLSALIQVIAGAIIQKQTGQRRAMIFDDVSGDLEMIFGLLIGERQKFCPTNVINAIFTIVREKGSINMPDLISYLMHN